METKATSVLVIEKHPIMREALCTVIAGETDFLLLDTAPDNSAAFQLEISQGHDVLFLAHKPDIILFSLGNPGLRDLQALSDLQKKLENTPILALTRDEVPGQEQAALEYGAQAVLTKAASREELLGALRSIKLSSQFVLQNAERNNYPNHYQKEICNVQNQS
jgi:DNA-binding NarL/FixJ family response regulator